MIKARFGLFGAGGSGREVMPYSKSSVAQTLGLEIDEVEVFFIETWQPDHSQVNGYPLISIGDFLSLDGPRYFNVALGDGRMRERIVNQVGGLATAASIYAQQSTFLDRNIIAEGAVFCPHTLVTSNVTIGKFFQANYFSSIAHDCVIGDYVTFGPGVRCNGRVHIHDYAYVGSNAVIKQGTSAKPLRIGVGAIVGMGAVVTKDVPDGMTVVGNPAKQLIRT